MYASTLPEVIRSHLKILSHLKHNLNSNLSLIIQMQINSRACSNTLREVYESPIDNSMC